MLLLSFIRGSRLVRFSNRTPTAEPLIVVRRVLRAQIGILPRHLLAIVRVCDAKVASAKIIVCGALQVGATVKAVGYGWCHLSGR